MTSSAYTVIETEISRLDMYGNQPACVQEKYPDLRKYCFCMKQEPERKNNARSPWFEMILFFTGWKMGCTGNRLWHSCKKWVLTKLKMVVKQKWWSSLYNNGNVVFINQNIIINIVWYSLRGGTVLEIVFFTSIS